MNSQYMISTLKHRGNYCKPSWYSDVTANSLNGSIALGNLSLQSKTPQFFDFRPSVCHVVNAGGGFYIHVVSKNVVMLLAC